LRRRGPRILAGAALALTACATSPSDTFAAPPRLLVVTVTKGFRHDSIPTAEKLVERLATRSGAFTVDFARTDEELAAKLGPSGRGAYAGVYFAHTSGDLPIPDPQGFLDWIATGRGLVGTHSASDTFPGFAPYLDMLGGHFLRHGPNHVKVGLLVKDGSHPVARAVPQPLEVLDEIYEFERYDPARVHLLLYVAKHPETGAPGEYPLAWTREHGQGRVFYTALGHRDDVLESEWYGAHLLAGIKWALGK
jgi:type 1 glutamine amidotransferase